MAAPITWQNVNGPDLAAASRPLDSAQRSFNSMFSQLGDVLAQRQRVDEENWQNTKTNNTNAYLDRLASFRTPEELAAAQQSGLLANMRSNFGAQIDSTAVRGAEDQRKAALMQQITAANAFDDQKAAREARPHVDAINRLRARGDTAGARAYLDKVVLPDEGALEMGVVESERGDIKHKQDVTRFGWDAEMQPWNLKAKRTAINQDEQSILESKARIENMYRDRELRDLEIEARKAAKSSGAREDKAYEEVVKNSAYSGGAWGTTEGRKTLTEGLTKLPNMDPADVSDIVYNVEQYYKDGVVVGVDNKGKPVKRPLPVEVILQAAAESSDNLAAIGFSRRGDHVAELIAERFGLLTGLGQDYDTPSRDQATKADMKLINEINMIEALRAKRMDRLKPKDKLKKAATIKNEFE